MSIENNQAGIVTGAVYGVYEGTKFVVSNIAMISWEVIVQACIIAFLGGALGWLGSETMNFFKRLYQNWKSKKHDKNTN